jgi:hypoxanthine phosphoribosyltransferase
VNNKKITPELAWRIFKKADCLYSLKQVESTVQNIADQINHAHSQDNPVIVCVLNGGLVLIGQLLPKLGFPLEVDYVHATRYRDNVGTEELSWISGPHCDAKDRTIVLVDDILDEGNTLAGIMEYYRKAGARKVVSAVLVVKERERKVDITPDIAGLTVPDRYVFGYGMDYKGYWRNAPGIYAEKE